MSPSTPGGPSVPEHQDGGSPLWFERKQGGVGFGPVTWQGRAAVALYAFLVLVALVTYSKLFLTVFVIGFYTVTFGLVLVVKSDLVKDWPPES
jgi:hypothetical protein